jgi:hypothetical protein
LFHMCSKAATACHLAARQLAVGGSAAVSPARRARTADSGSYGGGIGGEPRHFLHGLGRMGPRRSVPFLAGRSGGAAGRRPGSGRSAQLPSRKQYFLNVRVRPESVV